MFLMWIIPQVLIGLVAYGLSGNNPARAFQPASSGATRLEKLPVLQADFMKGKSK